MSEKATDVVAGEDVRMHTLSRANDCIKVIRTKPIGRLSERVTKEQTNAAIPGLNP